MESLSLNTSNIAVIDLQRSIEVLYLRVLRLPDGCDDVPNKSNGERFDSRWTVIMHSRWTVSGQLMDSYPNGP